MRKATHKTKKVKFPKRSLKRLYIKKLEKIKKKKKNKTKKKKKIIFFLNTSMKIENAK